jgi:hypothetical protein
MKDSNRMKLSKLDEQQLIRVYGKLGSRSFMANSPASPIDELFLVQNN